ncbi:MAG: TetR/AcrR family transcriptional regulator C-terminal domain-containing protein [Clostridia bacterium]|nr:TetR/AcrR family transcriptional regulator C-terminal domain-containing protein [Clostridia bacterium]
MPNFTKKAITDSFLKLLNEKKFDKITIKNIVADCGVSRKTFYYYFEDIYDLLQKYLADLTEESVKSIDDVESFEAELIKLMDFVMQNKRAVYHIYNSVSRERLEDYLYESSLPVMKATILKKLEGKSYDAGDADIFSKVCANAFTGSVLRWIKEGMPDDFEDMIRLVSSVFDSALKAIGN